ncbi:MAG TPA: hypothetical protein VM555_11310 [Tahibacter sp.]|nr:hypothetical protein [Tahibacter sp.]
MAGTLFIALVALLVVVTLSRNQPQTPTVHAAAPPALDDLTAHSPVRSAVEPTQQSADGPSRTAPAAELPVPNLSVSASKTKRFRETKKCAGAVRAIESMRRQRIACDSQSAWPDVWAACKKRIASFDEKLVRAESILSECSAADIGDSESRYWQDVVAAAEAGDKDAALCFIQSDFMLERPWSAEEVARYKILAPVYIDRALSAGDWRIAELLSMGPRGISSGSLLGTQTRGDRITQYRMNRLLRLGAIGDYAAKLDILSTNPGSPLPGNDQTAAEAWAKDMHARYFLNSPKLDSNPIPCAVVDKDISPHPF